MTLQELQKVYRTAFHARQALSALDRTHHVDISMQDADDDYLVTVYPKDPAFTEMVKAHIREEQSKILAETTATLARHGIEMEPAEAEELEDAA